MRCTYTCLVPECEVDIWELKRSTCAAKQIDSETSQPTSRRQSLHCRAKNHILDSVCVHIISWIRLPLKKKTEQKTVVLLIRSAESHLLLYENYLWSLVPFAQPQKLLKVCTTEKVRVSPPNRECMAIHYCRARRHSIAPNLNVTDIGWSGKQKGASDEYQWQFNVVIIRRTFTHGKNRVTTKFNGGPR